MPLLYILLMKKLNKLAYVVLTLILVLSGLAAVVAGFIEAGSAAVVFFWLLMFLAMFLAHYVRHGNIWGLHFLDDPDEWNPPFRLIREEYGEEVEVEEANANANYGFTLLELLICIVVVMMIAAILHGACVALFG